MYNIKNNKLKIISIAILLCFGSLPVNGLSSSIVEKYFNCTDVKIIWARESGASINDRNYQEFTKSFANVFSETNNSFSFYELSSNGGYGGYYYPAPGIGIESSERFKTSLGALVSGGNSYDYGESIEAGSNEASLFVHDYLNHCPESKIILGGFSQGGQTVSRTLQKLDDNSINHLVYAATFGDPKLYLPEGKGLTPPACRNENLSEYRAYVPDCHVYEGVLGGYKPYDVDSRFNGKIGAYCRYHDIICGVYTDPENWYNGHADYIGGGLYDVAANTALSKLTPTRAQEKKVQNLAILFDVTGSMAPLFAQYKSEMLKMAKRILDNGGKVAVYTYGDLEDYETTELCNFETCNLETIEEKIKVVEYSGGDEPESVLSASYTLMKKLKWDKGANKSLVVLTDAGFHNPDRDGITLDEVVELSLSIDPVNFYVLGADHEDYSELTIRTDGKMYASTNSEEIMADLEQTILLHQDAEIYNLNTEATKTIISDIAFETLSNDTIKLSFNSTGQKNLLFLNESLLGSMDKTEIEITDLDLTKENNITIAPISLDGYRGESASISISEPKDESRGAVGEKTVKTIIPKVPNSGKL